MSDKFVVVAIPPTDDGFATRVFGVFHSQTTAQAFVDKVIAHVETDETAERDRLESLREPDAPYVDLNYGSAYVRRIHRPNVGRATAYAKGEFDS